MKKETKFALISDALSLNCTNRRKTTSQHCTSINVQRYAIESILIRCQCTQFRAFEVKTTFVSFCPGHFYFTSVCFYALDTFTEGGFWIGGNDNYADSAWRWETGEFLTYTNWDPGEPSSTYSYSDCMRVRNNWLWHDMDCNLPYESICEKDPAA